MGLSDGVAPRPCADRRGCVSCLLCHDVASQRHRDDIWRTTPRSRIYPLGGSSRRRGQGRRGRLGGAARDKLDKLHQRGFTRCHAGPKAEARSVDVKVPLEWVWENDPEELPDDDHARCIAAGGERFVACGGQLFVLTTRPCDRPAASRGGRGAMSLSTLQMEYLGLDWPRGLAQQCWGSDSFDCGSSSGGARQSAGLALLATVAGALAAGSLDSESSPRGVGFDDLRQTQRPPGWPPRLHARRPPHPSLLPLIVGSGRDRS